MIDQLCNSPSSPVWRSMGTARFDTAEFHPVATVDSKSKDKSSKSESKVDQAATQSCREQRRPLKLVARRVIIYLRKFSPVNVLKRFRDCYVKSLGACAQSYSHQSYGMGFISPSCSSPHVRVMTRTDTNSGSCLSPAFKQSFNQSILPGYRNQALFHKAPNVFPEVEPIFRRSFSDYESCLSPTMKKVYNEAAAISPGRHSWSSSPGRTPRRMLSGQLMVIFPIEEAPELARASFRKESGFTSVPRTGTQPVPKPELEVFV